MKAVVLCLLLGCCRSCFGQMDTNLIGAGDWSEPVRDHAGFALRGRLLIYDSTGQDKGGSWAETRVYLELQEPDTFVSPIPVEIYLDLGHEPRFEMTDAHGKRVPSEGVAIRGFGPPPPCWFMMPCDSTIRVRVDPLMSSTAKPDGLEIFLLSSGMWTIPPGSTNDYYLSATFTPPTNSPSCLHYHAWQGTLNLPKVKIPAKKP